MKQRKKLYLFGGLLFLAVLLTGCVQTDASGHPTGDGWVYNLLVRPMSAAIHFFANNLHLGYGLAIIVITLIVRLCILPLGLSQSKKMMLQQEKMQAIQPEMQRIQEKMRLAQTEEEKQKLTIAYGALMKENNISLFGGMGCLPLIIQMPFFTALYFSARYTPGIDQSVFLGFSLGKASILFALIAMGAYFLQSYLSSLSVPKEQRKQMMMPMMVSPIMIGMMSFNAPAGVTLYWIIGGIFSCIQTLIINFYHKPRIKKQVAEQLKKNPPKTTIDVDEIIPQDMIDRHRERQERQQAQAQGQTEDHRRNAGKQRHRHDTHDVVNQNNEPTSDESTSNEDHRRNAGKQNHPH